MKKLIAIGIIALTACAPRSWGDTHYVDISCKTPRAPYTTQQTASTNITDAIKAAGDGDTVLVLRQGDRVLVGEATRAPGGTPEVGVGATAETDAASAHKADDG